MVAAVLSVAAVVACKDNPNIDGSKVAASAATCPDVCNRLVALCGFAPSDCTDDDAGGYCDVNLADDTVLTCMATAASCQDAWDCPNATPPDDDAGDESSTDDDASPGDDGATTDDGATE